MAQAGLKKLDVNARFEAEISIRYFYKRGMCDLEMHFVAAYQPFMGMKNVAHKV